MAAEGDFKVKMIKKEVVAADLPLQEHWLPFSNLDLLLPPVDVGVFFCYRKPPANSGDAMVLGSIISVLKKALAQALVPYYAFACEIVANTMGEPELLCNNRGVDFIDAYADVELRNLDFHNPDESIEGKLVPKKEKGVLSAQATELKCGGLVVACIFDHRVADAYSANMFLVSWAEMARSQSISTAPSFRRSLLNCRRPWRIDPSLDHMYLPISSLPASKQDHPTIDKPVSRLYYITAENLNKLQSLACSNGNKRTKFESFCAFLWKIVALRAAKDNSKITKMGIIVDGRARLGEGDKGKASLMSCYFGNVLSIPYGAQNVNELIEKPLSWVANQVHKFLDQAVTKEHFLGLIDWVEAHRPEPAMARIYCNGSYDGPAFVVSSGQRFPFSRVNFGWGSPVFGSYHFPWGGDSGYVMPMPSLTREGDWVVYMHLFKRQLELIETEAGNVFRPLTSDYVDFNKSS